ncbi:hypothetical protein RZS08_47070, partial [Arthrospira platensis SPKY1]|nr:hypothetical protein [Arthrospira platensis SPKY1]
LMANPAEVEALLQQGAAKARAVATPFSAKLRHAVGLRALNTQAAAATKAAKVALPSFKQYREADGQFYFKLQDAKGALLLQSVGFASPKEAGQTIAQLKAQGWVVALQAAAPMTTGVAEADVN